MILSNNLKQAVHALKKPSNVAEEKNSAKIGESKLLQSNVKHNCSLIAVVATGIAVIKLRAITFITKGGVGLDSFLPLINIIIIYKLHLLELSLSNINICLMI